MFAKSFNDSPFLNRRRVDWTIGLTMACAKGAFISRFLGSYGFEIGQFLYLHQSGSKMVAPIFRMLKDGPAGDEVQEATLEWAQYGVFVASFHAAWIWSCVSATVRDLSILHLALLSALLCAGIQWLFFKPSISLDQAYSKYRQLESQIMFRRNWLLWQIFLQIRPIAEKVVMPIGRIVTQLGRGMRILPPAVPAKDKKSYRYNEMAALTEIRLLCLVPSPFSRVVRCRMENHPLDQLPDYEAISYTWGDESKIQQILIDGCWLTVTQNAYDALYNRSFFARTQRVWIDSVCINQVDIPEKDKQLPLMAQIYKQASRVIVCLGDRPDAHMVPDVLTELKRRREWYDETVLGEKLFREYIPQETSPRWQAFLNLLDQPYFGRIWVLQEVAVARTVHAVYGNRYIDWGTLVESLRMFLNEKSADSRALLYSAGDNYKTRQVSNAPGFASIMTTTKQLLEEGNSPPLSVLLQATHAFKAKDPRDKLFALLGISHPSTWGPVRADYTKDVVSLYRETARHIIFDEQSLLLLHHTGIGNTRNVKDLPSWVPDWSGYSMNNWSQGQTYIATKDRKPEIRGMTSNGVKDQNAVAIRGKIVDTIQCLSKERMNAPNEDSLYEGELNAKRQHAWYVEMRDLVDRHVPATYKTGQLKDEALWRTMIGDHGLDDVRPAPKEYGDHYQLWQRMLADHETMLACAKQNTLLPGFNTEQELSDATMLYTRFNSAFGPVNNNRRFCITKNGYIGMVPPGTQAGDLICILFGTDTPFVIRDLPTPDEVRKSYELVGDCYVHGMMDGEGMDFPQPEEYIILR